MITHMIIIMVLPALTSMHMIVSTLIRIPYANTYM